MVEIIGEGSSQDRDSIALSTKLGTWIPNVKHPEEQTPEITQAKIDVHKKFVDRVEAQLRSISSAYNCVGMVFAARRVHIDVKHVRMILREDGYQKIDESHIMDDDIVVYTLKGQVIHIGRIMGTVKDENGHLQWRILSKWGKDGEYFHNIKDIPEFLQFDAWEIWSEKRRKP